MRETGTLFKGEMVRPILRGTKTMTRRLVKPQPDDVSVCGKPVRFVTQKFLEDGQVVDRDRDAQGNRYVKILTCPYGEAGDRLWVKETFQPILADGMDYAAASYKTGKGYSVSYPATDGRIEFYDLNKEELSDRCTPSIFMPRWASRILLDVTATRLERLHAITDEDAIREGAIDWWEESKARYRTDAGLTPREAFRLLWIEINGIDSWNANPWVWVVEFRRVEASG